jgi:hypothetical protein
MAVVPAAPKIPHTVEFGTNSSGVLSDFQRMGGGAEVIIDSGEESIFWKVRTALTKQLSP